MAAVFVAYLVIGLAMPVLPLHVHQGLGFGTFVVGLVSGTQFSAALFSRVWAGQHADSRGAKHTVLTGLSVAVAAGLFYLISLRLVAKPEASVAILLVGRALLGGAESFVITGALSWGLALLGAQNTGKVMAWRHRSVGSFRGGCASWHHALRRRWFCGDCAGDDVDFARDPAAGRVVPPVASTRNARAAFADVAGAVWVPGLGLALSGVGFGAIVTFIALLFAQRGWSPVWLPFTSLSVAFMLGRIFSAICRTGSAAQKSPWSAC